MKVSRFVFSVFLLICFATSGYSQSLAAEAGNNTTLCPGTSYTLGGSPVATGGTPPYSYQWSPSSGLSNTTASNPIASPSVPTWYFVTVTDSAGNTATDSVHINLDPIYAYNAGNDTAICIGSTATLGSPYNSYVGGVSYAWTPSTSLNNDTVPRPVTNTSVTISYSVTITSPNCPSKSYDVTVTVNPTPTVTACCSTTINEGQTATFNATGAMSYVWAGSSGSISDPTGNPVTVEPTQTAIYIVYGTDQNGCMDSDTLTVEVIPGNELVFYNTFSPNHDGINDFFYIGNIQKYPDCRLEVYTRTGQLVYAKTGYDNSWDGTNYGDKLPEATYYYVLDPGDGSPKYYKSVTIVR